MPDFLLLFRENFCLPLYYIIIMWYNAKDMMGRLFYCHKLQKITPSEDKI